MILHASCVAIETKGILLAGPAGVGKSDLALRLINEGAHLVADDQTELNLKNDQLIASPPAAIAGLFELRHIGLVKMPFEPFVRVALYIELLPLAEPIERLPDTDTVLLLGQAVTRFKLPAYAASTPAKIRAALFCSFATTPS